MAERSRVEVYECGQTSAEPLIREKNECETLLETPELF